MATEHKQETSSVKSKQVKLRVVEMYGNLQARVLENAVFVKSKAFLGWSHVEFVRLKTGFVYKLLEDNTVESVGEVAIPRLLRSGDMDGDVRDSLALGDETLLTAVDPESVDNASVLRVTVSNPMPVYTGHLAVNREEVIEAIRRYFSGHILTMDAVLGIVVNNKELRVQVTDMHSLSFTRLNMGKIGVFTEIRVSPALGLSGVTLLTEISDSKAKADDTESKTQPKAKADDIDRREDAQKTSETLTSEAMRVFHAYMSIVQYESECPDDPSTMQYASKILGCRLKQIAKEMERRSA